MDAQRWQQAQALFHEVLALPGEVRPAYLDAACAQDPMLRGLIDGMLEADEDAPDILDASLDGLSSLLHLPTAPSPIGQHIGPYRILRELGRGGMGTVYLAEREDIQKQVALKLVRDPLASPERAQRFLFERRVLARLEHPNIARLHDAGVTEQGTPYFVMEYIEGLPIDAYCDAHRLTIDERLPLFEHVCKAVQYAHRNLIVHRDLKPSNILVTTAGTVKLLDFGIAKLLDDDLEELVLTRSGVRVMTPEYAAPEQVLGEPVSTATDVYALGIILYRLLTGHRPYRLTSTSIADIERVICEQEPERPSTVIHRVEEYGQADDSTTPLTTEQICRARQTQADRLRRRLNGDLDTILLMALRKEPARRYASAGHFLNDLKRHRTGLPVEARADTWTYRTHKFVRRHTAGLTLATALVALSIVFGLLYTARVTEERDRARTQSEKATQVASFLKSMLSEAAPSQSQGATMTALEMLDQGAQKIERELAAQPDVQAELLLVMSDVYWEYGRYDQAELFARRSLDLRRMLYGPMHVDVAANAEALAKALRRKAAYEEAEARYQEALTIYRALQGETHANTANIVRGLADLAKDRGDYETAMQHYNEALALQRALLGNQHPELLVTMNNMGGILVYTGRYDEAEQVFREGLTASRKMYGEIHPEVATYMNNLAYVMIEKGDYEEAERLLRETLRIRQHLYQGDHPRLATTFKNLGRALRYQGNYDAAERFLRDAAAINHRFLEGHPKLALVLHDLGELLVQRGENAEAEALFQEALAIYRDKVGDEHKDRANTLSQLGLLLLNDGRPGEAEPLLREALAIHRKVRPGDHALIGRELVGLGTALITLGRAEEGNALLLEGLTLLE